MDKTKKAAFFSGILLIVLFACTATLVAGFEWVKILRLSPLIVGIILGMVYANTLRKQVPTEWNPGIAFCTRQVLRTGIVLYGFQITVSDVLAVGLPAIVVDVVVVSFTLILGVVLGRLLKMDSQTALLTSVGSSICGAAAVLGAEPVVKGEPYKTAVAVSTVVIFGTVAMFLYPTLYRAGVFDLDAGQMGLYTGGTLHEVAHVYGAGEAMDAAGLSSDSIKRPAVIVKMVRVILLAPVLVVLAFMLSRRNASSGPVSKISIPIFPFLFLAAIGVNSLGIIPMWAADSIRTLSTFMLTMAMTALGVETSFDKFCKAGPKPFLLALLLFCWLIFGGYWLVKSVTLFIH